MQPSSSSCIICDYCNFILVHTSEVKSVPLMFFFISNLPRCHYAIQKALETCKYNSQDANDLSNEENEV